MTEDMRDSIPTPDSMRDQVEEERRLLDMLVNGAIGNNRPDHALLAVPLGSLRRLLHRADRLDMMRTRHGRILEQVRRLNYDVRYWKCEAELGRLQGRLHRKVYDRVYKVWTEGGADLRAKLMGLFHGKCPIADD